MLRGPEEMAECRALILPGVGAFGDCMANLRRHGYVEPVQAWIAEDRPFLGICLGLQVLCESSEESPGVEGFGVVPSPVVKFVAAPEIKVPQIGWNRVRRRASEIRLEPRMQLTFNGIAQGHAADWVAEMLRAEGFGDVLIDMGEVMALGRSACRAWQAAIAAPDGTELARVGLQDRALATSSPDW